MTAPKDLGEIVSEALGDLPSDIRKKTAKVGDLLTSIGEEGFELAVALVVMIMVERTYGQQGLGIFAYLSACLYGVRYLANYGVARHVEIETARHTSSDFRNRLIRDGVQAIGLTAFAGAGILLVSAGFDTAHTRIHEHIGGYAIMAIALPLANMNSLKLAALQGLGEHTRVARLRMFRHATFLAAMFVLTRLRLPPSFLLAAYVVSDVFTRFRIRHHLPMPKGRAIFRNPRRAWVTLKHGQAHLFTDNALEMLINIDLFVLGLFVSAWELGAYAEAAVLVRMFLIISLGIKPILRRRYTRLAARKKIRFLTADFLRQNALLFTLQAVLALMVLLYFPMVLDVIFEFDGSRMKSFQIFLIFVPGLLYYSVFYAQEPIYEALHRADALKNMSLIVAGINVLLSAYLIPTAGVMGAAAATTATMLIHFFLFGRHLGIGSALQKSTLVAAGLALYLAYNLMAAVNLSPAINVWVGPLVLLALFYGCGVFGTASQSIHSRKETLHHDGTT